MPYCLFGLIYVTMPVLMLLDLYKLLSFNVHDTYFIIGKGHIPIVIIASIWINDTMAYLVGSFIGRTQLTKISPKKTWEGTLGGIVLSIVTIGIVIYLMTDFWPIALYGMIIAATCAIFGTLGDLFESKLKRIADVKDSGSFMPGHGGFLDRFDSLLFAVPAVWAYVYLFVK